MYKIVCKDLNIKDCYVGHTTNFTERKRQHKFKCTSDHNFKVYQIIRDNGGWNNWEMIMIEIFKCNNEIEAKTRERFWFEQLNSTLNTIYPIRSRQEHYQDEKEIILAKQKLYHHEHKDEINERRKEIYEQNKEKIIEQKKEYVKRNKEKVTEQRKKCYERTKEHILEYRKSYYEANKDKINEDLKTKKFVCECGSSMRCSEKSRHIKSKKHQEFINTA
jgi:hypothetical protein